MFDLGERLPPPRRRSRLGRAWNALGRDLAVDLGTANTLVFDRGHGVVLDQPSFAAIDVETGRFLAIGAEAKEMLGRAPEPIEVIRPLRSGVIGDFEAAQFLLREFLLRVHHRRRFVRPRVIVCVPSGVTQVERRAVEEAAFEAGARRVAIVSEPLAAAVGAGLPVEAARGSMVVDIGGGTTDVAVFVLGGTVANANAPVGGDALDQAVLAFCRKELGIAIGERAAERLKIVGGAAAPGVRNTLVEFLGRDAATGRPRTVRVHSDALAEGMAEPVGTIVDTAISVFERMPAEIVPDIAVRGITLTGGGALLAGLAVRMQREAGIPVHVDPEPLSCVVRGAGALLDRLPGGMGRRGME
ncbi:MAG TPA: rod shape-determining protein [Actinomycetota bacterium]|nr:rod shape-determining protein [Actinomycetota bacterium]